MSLATYSDLKTAIATWSWRSDLTSDVDDLIDLTEARLNRDLRLSIMEARATLNTAIDDEFIALPTDAIEIRKLSIQQSGADIPLRLSSPSDLVNRYYEGLSRQPAYYAVVGTELQLAPIPDAIYSLSATYIAKVPALSDSQTTNAVLTNHPDLYLFGALAEAADLVRDAEYVARWESKYQACVSAAKEADNRLKFNGTPLVERAG